MCSRGRFCYRKYQRTTFATFFSNFKELFLFQPKKKCTAVNKALQIYAIFGI